MLYFKTSDSTAALDKTLSDGKLLLQVVTEISPAEREAIRYIFHLLNFQDKAHDVVEQDKKPTKSLKAHLKEAREEKASIYRDFLILGNSPQPPTIFFWVCQSSRDRTSENALENLAKSLPAVVFEVLVSIFNIYKLGIHLRYFVENELMKERGPKPCLLDRSKTTAIPQQKQSTPHTGTPTQEHRVEITVDNPGQQVSLVPAPLGRASGESPQLNRKRQRDDAFQSQPPRKKVSSSTSLRGTNKFYPVSATDFCIALRRCINGAGVDQEFHVNRISKEEVRVDIGLSPTSPSQIVAFLCDTTLVTEDISLEQLCDYIQVRLGDGLDRPQILVIDCTGSGILSASIPQIGRILFSAQGMVGFCSKVKELQQSRPSSE